MEGFRKTKKHTKDKAQESVTTELETFLNVKQRRFYKRNKKKGRGRRGKQKEDHQIQFSRRREWKLEEYHMDRH